MGLRRCTCCLGDTLYEVHADLPEARVAILVCASCDLRPDGALEPSRTLCGCGNLLTITHPTECRECAAERSV